MSHTGLRAIKTYPKEIYNELKSPVANYELLGLRVNTKGVKG